MAKRTLLYVEDEQWLMSGVVDALSNEYDVLRARNGDQALDILESGEHKVDLILLDIMMPTGEKVRDLHHGRTAGVEFARIVMEQEGYDIPIICYTVVSDRRIHEELMRIGVKEIVSKRELPSELERVIKRHLR